MSPVACGLARIPGIPALAAKRGAGVLALLLGLRVFVIEMSIVACGDAEVPGIPAQAARRHWRVVGVGLVGLVGLVGVGLERASLVRTALRGRTFDVATEGGLGAVVVTGVEGEEHRQPLRRACDAVVDLRQLARHTGHRLVRDGGGAEGGDAEEDKRAEPRSALHTLGAQVRLAAQGLGLQRRG